MEPQNLTGLSEFLLLGLSDDPDLQPLLFGLFLSTYLVTVFGNLLIILAVISDPHLHTLMYSFLSSLSLGWHQFQHHHCPQDVTESLDTQQIHPLCRVSSSGDLFLSFWMFGESPSDGDFLWPVGGHLSPPTPPPLWLIGPGVIFHQPFDLPAALLGDVTAYLLCRWWNTSFLLWPFSTPQPFLFWHLHQYHISLFH